MLLYVFFFTIMAIHTNLYARYNADIFGEPYLAEFSQHLASRKTFIDQHTMTLEECSQHLQSQSHALWGKYMSQELKPWFLAPGLFTQLTPTNQHVEMILLHIFVCDYLTILHHEPESLSLTQQSSLFNYKIILASQEGYLTYRQHNQRIYSSDAELFRLRHQSNALNAPLCKIYQKIVHDGLLLYNNNPQLSAQEIKNLLIAQTEPGHLSRECILGMMDEHSLKGQTMLTHFLHDIQNMSTDISIPSHHCPVLIQLYKERDALTKRYSQYFLTFEKHLPNHPSPMKIIFLKLKEWRFSMLDCLYCFSQGETPIVIKENLDHSERDQAHGKQYIGPTALILSHDGVHAWNTAITNFKMQCMFQISMPDMAKLFLHIISSTRPNMRNLMALYAFTVLHENNLLPIFHETEHPISLMLQEHFINNDMGLLPMFMSLAQEHNIPLDQSLQNFFKNIREALIPTIHPHIAALTFKDPRVSTQEAMSHYCIAPSDTYAQSAELMFAILLHFGDQWKVQHCPQQWQDSNPDQQVYEIVLSEYAKEQAHTPEAAPLPKNIFVSLSKAAAITSIRSATDSALYISVPEKGVSIAGHERRVIVGCYKALLLITCPLHNFAGPQAIQHQTESIRGSLGILNNDLGDKKMKEKIEFYLEKLFTRLYKAQSSMTIHALAAFS